VNHRDTERNYADALILARTIAETHLSAHVQVAGGDRDETLEDLAQSIVGTESVVRLIMTVPFHADIYEPVLIEAADEVGRAFFPDVHKRFVSSLDDVPEGALVQTSAEEVERAGPDLMQVAESLPDDLKAYLGRLAEDAGVECITSHLWSETNADALAGRLARLRRHYPDGDIRLGPHANVEQGLSRSQIIARARQVAAGLEIAFPWGFFAHQTQDRIAVATRYLVENELRRAPEELLKEGMLPFVALGLGPALRRCGGSVNRLLALGFPDRVRPWMDSHVPPGYWDTPTHRQEAIRWLIESRLGLSPESIADAVHEGHITKRDFSDAGLTWLIKNVYRWSVADALAEAYPTLLPWERCRRVQTTLWKGKTGRVLAAEAIRWALKRAGLAQDDLRVQSAAHEIKASLRKWHLIGAFTIGFGGDAVSALEAVFPGCYRPWEITHMPRDAWSDPALRAEAVRWLLAKLGISPAEIPRSVAQGRLTPDTFKDAGLDGLLRVTGSVWRAISDVFPGRFARWELGAVPRSYWRSRVHVQEAVRWALARLEVLPDAVMPALREGRLSANELVRLGLGSLVVGVFRADLVALCQVAEVLPSERRVPLSRYYRQLIWEEEGPSVSWRLRSKVRLSHGMDSDAGSELERHVTASRSMRQDRRRRS